MSKAIETTPLEIIRALRCAATPNGDCVGKACSFYVEETVPEEMIAEVSRVEWPGCDVEAINMAAADLIERMAREVERRDKLLNTLGVKIGEKKNDE